MTQERKEYLKGLIKKYFASEVVIEDYPIGKYKADLFILGIKLPIMFEREKERDGYVDDIMVKSNTFDVMHIHTPYNENRVIDVYKSYKDKTIYYLEGKSDLEIFIDISRQFGDDWSYVGENLYRFDDEEFVSSNNDIVLQGDGDDYIYSWGVDVDYINLCWKDIKI